MRKRIRLPAEVRPGDYLKIRDDVGGGAERRYEIQVPCSMPPVCLLCLYAKAWAGKGFEFGV